MRRQELLKAILSATLVLVLCVGAGLAQGPPPDGAQVQYQGQEQEQGQAPDPPGRVARLQYMSGQVSIQPGGVNEWIAAAQNRPLTSADRVWTDKESRSELSLGTAAIRMNSETSLTLTNVSDESVQLQLDQGTLSVTVFQLFKGEIYEVDTPNIAFTIMKPGEYRFDVLPDADQTWVTVRKGRGEATGQGRAVRVNDGEQVRFSAGASLTHTAESAPRRDGFEDWVKIRNQREGNSVSARYVAPGVIGYEDLDTYGTWRPAPEYGYVWYPTAVAPGWAPYRYGHWAWIEPWGWTWVDDAAWGFAPYHYGRWVFWRGAWGWCPGPVVAVRPVYAPALVGWFGGPHFGVGLSIGVGAGVGWFPLGFGEPFVPWYHTGPGYFRNVNVSNTRITNVTVINNIYVNRAQVTNIHYVNRNVSGAVTATSNASFVGGHDLARAGVAVPASALQHGEVMRTAQVAPVKESVLGGHAPLAHGAPPARVFSRPVVTNQAPPPRPVSFEAKQAALSRNNGMPLDHSTLNHLRVQQTQQTPNHGQPGANANVSTGGGPAGHNAPANMPNAGGNAAHAPNMGGNAVRTPNTGGSAANPANTGNTRTVPRPPVPGTKGTVYENSGGGNVTGNTVPHPSNSTNGPVVNSSKSESGTAGTGGNGAKPGASTAATGPNTSRPGPSTAAPGPKNAPAPDLKRAPATHQQQQQPQQEQPHQQQQRPHQQTPHPQNAPKEAKPKGEGHGGKEGAAIARPPANYAYRPASPGAQTTAGSGGNYVRNSGATGNASAPTSAPAAQRSQASHAGGQSARGSSGGHGGGPRG